MKKITLLTANNRFEPLFAKFDWPIPDILTLFAVAVILTLVVMLVQKNQETQMPEVKSVAWFTANQNEARATNKACFENKQLQATENCINSLHALEISHQGSNT